MGTTEVREEVVLRQNPASPPPAASTSGTRTEQPTIDWSGRAAVGGSDGHDPIDPGAASEGASGTRRLAAVAGVGSVLYVAWIVVDLVVLAISGTAYTSMHEALGSLPARSILCLAWLALLYHGADGLRVVATDFAPRLERRDPGLRWAVGFVVFAVWIPTALVIVWPAVRGWFAA